MAVQIWPPSADIRFDKAPLATVTSATVKSCTASLKRNVTVAVSPPLSAVSVSSMAPDSVGAVWSNV